MQTNCFTKFLLSKAPCRSYAETSFLSAGVLGSAEVLGTGFDWGPNCWPALAALHAFTYRPWSPSCTMECPSDTFLQDNTTYATNSPAMDWLLTSGNASFICARLVEALHRRTFPPRTLDGW